MSQNFSRGDFCPAIWQSAVGGPGTVAILNSHDDNLDIEALLIDVTNTGSGGGTSRLAGKLDAKGTVNASYDLDIPPYLAPIYVQAGLRGFYGKTLGPSRVVQIPTVCGKVHFQSGVENEVKYSFDVAMDARLGVLSYPAI